MITFTPAVLESGVQKLSLCWMKRGPGTLKRALTHHKSSAERQNLAKVQSAFLLIVSAEVRTSQLRGGMLILLIPPDSVKESEHL